MTLHSTDPTLYALFCLVRQTLPVHTGTLGRLTGRSASQIALDLLQLESSGLAFAAPARLTMLGLARAAQLARASGDAALPDVEVKPRKAPQRIKPPVAAKERAGHNDHADRAGHAGHAGHAGQDEPEALSA